MKKYEFTDKTKILCGKELKQIRRISDGLIGGWIEKEENLSHYGNCWVYGEAVVCDNARIYGDARVYGDAIVRGNAMIYDNARVYGDARVCDNAGIYGEVQKNFESVEFYQSSNSRLVTAITDKEGNTLFNIGCQKLITKEEFLHRIENEDGGIRENPHREFYKKILLLY